MTYECDDSVPKPGHLRKEKVHDSRGYGGFKWGFKGLKKSNKNVSRGAAHCLILSWQGGILSRGRGPVAKGIRGRRPITAKVTCRLPNSALGRTTDRHWISTANSGFLADKSFYRLPSFIVFEFHPSSSFIPYRVWCSFPLPILQIRRDLIIWTSEWKNFERI